MFVKMWLKIGELLENGGFKVLVWVSLALVLVGIYINFLK